MAAGALKCRWRCPRASVPTDVSASSWARAAAAATLEYQAGADWSRHRLARRQPLQHQTRHPLTGWLLQHPGCSLQEVSTWDPLEASWVGLFSARLLLPTFDACMQVRAYRIPILT